jgi:hypothetical protein
MAYYIKNIQTTEDFFRLQYQGIDINNLALNVDSLFLKEGYKRTAGINGNGDYEKGSRVMRLLFGALAKYFKFTTRLKIIEDQSIELMVVKSSSGISGGLIGIGQVKNELNRLLKLFSGI